MTINVTSPVTGAAQTGLTSPTYTLTTDNNPGPNGKQWAVTALGGTQTNVTTHSVASPFLITCWKPANLRVLGSPNVNTGVIANVPNNDYRVVVRKGVIPLAGQPSRVATCDVRISVPAGSDLASPENIRAMLSCAFGVVAQQSAGIGDTAVSGIM